MRSKKILKYLFRLTSMMFHRHTKIFVEAHTIDLIKFFLFHFKHHRLLDQSAATQFSTNMLGVQKVFGELSITCHSMDCQFEGCLFRQIRDRSQIFPRIKAWVETIFSKWLQMARLPNWRNSENLGGQLATLSFSLNFLLLLAHKRSRSWLR